MSDVTDALERVSFGQTEQNYMSGATALVQQEIALIQQALYHKPGYSRNWSWDYQAEARIHGRSKPAKQYDWDETPETRTDADEDEPEGRPVFRDAGSITIAVQHYEAPKPPVVVIKTRLTHIQKDLVS